ncbi:MULTISPECIES: META domain-containing protein [Brevibacterium]|uniref:META domain-containing protein n=1 Tax=Brevibacterium casei TaxID=33889 RepID=A0A161RPT8_9MICO|nr:META domain-containing protein [Brevibacterium casei]NJE66001.1 META domain-containing protein [Brevibacterium sp. LS14]KZE09964.1 hypothetical protein AVW13_03370 [Brevibacterium casei]MCT1448230.1 META domain-containing protein [Brevibacterium casei]MCT2359680.1 META domain-containing protein [Brevibacterium casei]MDH5149541.1 META domain-containing protein [Brevibacterium casei]
MDIATQHRPSLRLLLGAVALAATLPLAACANGAEPSEPASSSASDPSTPSETESATVDPVGKWTSPEAGEPFLELKEDGSVEGSDGCNAIKSSWTLDGDTITIEPFTSTQKACAGVDSWLSKAAAATIEGDVMTVKDGQGSVIGGLEKQ